MLTTVTCTLRNTAPTTLRRLATTPRLPATPSLHTLRTPLRPRPLIARYKEDAAPEPHPPSTAAKHTASHAGASQPPATQQGQQQPQAPATRSDDASLMSPFLAGPPSLHRLSRYMTDMQREMDDMMRAFLPTSAASPFSLLAPPSDLLGPEASLLGPLLAPPPTSMLTPLHIEETDSSFIVAADVPGMSKDDVKVSLTPDHELVIRGEKREESESKEGEGEEGAFRQRRYRNFVRRVRLPEWVEGDKIQARTKDGVLTVTIPKSESHKEQQVKEIPVTSD